MLSGDITSLTESVEIQPQIAAIYYFVQSQNVCWANVTLSKQFSGSERLWKQLMVTLIQYQVYLLAGTATQLSFDLLNHHIIIQLRIQTATVEWRTLTLD